MLLATSHSGFLGLPEHFLADMLAMIGFGVVLVLIVGFGLKVADFIWRKLDLEEQVQKGNIAAGIVMGATVLGFCYAVAHLLVGILG